MESTQCASSELQLGALLFFFGTCFVVIVRLFLSILLVFVFVFMLSLELYFVHVPLIFFYPADHVPDWQPCINYWVWLMPERAI